MATPLFLRRRYWRNSVQEGVVLLRTLELNSGQFEASLGWLLVRGQETAHQNNLESSPDPLLHENISIR